MRPDESVAVNPLEVKLLTSESFRDFAPASLLGNLRLEGSGRWQRLVVPSHAGELDEVLRDYAVFARIDPDDAIVAIALAERVGVRVRPGAEGRRRAV